MQLGYWLSGEVHTAPDLVRYAQMAEDSGFEWVLVSDHYHPWFDRQGQSPFVWSVLGGIAATTKRLQVATGVACPLFRIHPAVLAQAVATLATMFEGRFALGVGTGENLNEHVMGQGWPPYKVRREMLEEVIDVLRLLWSGGLHSHRGKYYTVDRARIYSLPEQPIPIYMAASGPQSAKMAARKADGLITPSISRSLLDVFDQNGGESKPRHAALIIAWGQDPQQALRAAHRMWHLGISGQLARDLPLPQDIERVAEAVTEEMFARMVVNARDPETYLQKIEEYRQAGYTHLHIWQLGPDLQGFMKLFEQKIGPKLA